MPQFCTAPLYIIQHWMSHAQGVRKVFGRLYRFQCPETKRVTYYFATNK